MANCSIWRCAPFARLIEFPYRTESISKRECRYNDEVRRRRVTGEPPLPPCDFETQRLSTTLPPVPYPAEPPSAARKATVARMSVPHPPFEPWTPSAPAILSSRIQANTSSTNTAEEVAEDVDTNQR